MRVVTSGYVAIPAYSSGNPITIQLGETIPVDKYFIIYNDQSTVASGVTYGGTTIEDKTTTSFKLKAIDSNAQAVTYQVIALS